MNLLAWRVGTTWSQWHIAHFGRPLCGTPLPAVVARLTARSARPNDWQYTCERCRETVLRQAPDPEESCRVCGYYKRGLDGRCVDCGARWPFKAKPAGSGEAADGPNGSTGTAGPVAAEHTAPAKNGQTP